MLPPAARLRRRVDFAATTRGGRRAGRPCLVVHFATGDSDAPGTARVGFAVSRAVGNAVVRNRVRRRLRHLVADRLDRLPAGSCLVVRALPPSAEYSFQELARDLDSALNAVLAPRVPRNPGPQRRRDPSRSGTGS